MPHSLWPLWTQTCRTFFRAYLAASILGEPRGLKDAILALFNLPSTSLRRSRGGKKQRATRSLASQLKAAQTLSQQSILATSQANPPPASADSSSRIPRAIALIQQGHVGRATRSLFQKDLAPVNQVTLQLMDSLHPQRAETVPPLPPNAPTLLQIDLDALAKIVKRSLANGSSPAGSGWTGDLLRPLIDDKDCLTGLGALIRDICTGTIPDSCRSLFVSSILIAVDKDSGGKRPIAMGECFYKLACLYILSLVRPEIPAILEPIQLALSPGGSEAAHHILQAAVDLHPGWVVVSTDLTNAFNTRNRAQILESLYKEEKLSPLWRLANWSYGTSSPLLLMDNGVVLAELLSTTGVKQGDNLGSLLWALSMKDTYSESINGLGCRAVAIMDDIYFFGPSAAVFTAFARFSTSLATRNTGLVINLGKSLALLPTGDQKAAALSRDHGIPTTTKLLPALGGVIGRSRIRISQWLVQQAKSLHTSLFEHILNPSLPSQHAFAILRLCVLPRMNYWSRIFPPEVFLPTAMAFDQVVLDTFCSKLSLPPLDSVAREQITLPVYLGVLVCEVCKRFLQ